MPKSAVRITEQNMYGRRFKILEGDAVQKMCEDLIAKGALKCNTAMMCRPFCKSGAGNPIISAHRSPIAGYEWDEVWFGYTGYTSEEDFLRSHGYFGSGRCYIVIKYKGENCLIALQDFVQYCPKEMLGPTLQKLGRGLFRYSKFFINAKRLPHHTHNIKDEGYWIEPAMVPDYDLYREQCFMSLGFQRNFGPDELYRYLTVDGWNKLGGNLVDHARWVKMSPGCAMIMNPRVLHGPACLLPHYEPQFEDDGYRMYEPCPGIPRWLLTGREIPQHLQLPPGSTFEAMNADEREELIRYLVSDQALNWADIHDPEYAEKHSCTPILDTETSDGKDAQDYWIIYGAFGPNNDEQVFASKRLVLKPGVSYTLNDPAGSDLIVVQGMGKIDSHLACAPRALLPGDLGDWTFMVPACKSREVKITNTGHTDMVMLRTFGPDHPDMPVLPWQDRKILVPKRIAAA